MGKVQYVKIEDLEVGDATDGALRATIIEIFEKQAKGFNITELTVDDGTGQMKLSLFNSDVEWSKGDIIEVGRIYVKEYNGTKSIAVGKGSSAWKGTKSKDEKTTGKEPKTKLDDEIERSTKKVEKPSTNQSSDKSDKALIAGLASIIAGLGELKDGLTAELAGVKSEIRRMKIAMLQQLKINAGILPGDTPTEETSEEPVEPDETVEDQDTTEG